MIQEAQVVLHGGSGQVLLPEYLFGVLVHLLAFAAIAVGARLWLGPPEARDARFATARNAEEGERESVTDESTTAIRAHDQTRS